MRAKMLLPLVALLVLAVVSVALGACGGGETSGQTATTVAVTTGSTVASETLTNPATNVEAISYETLATSPEDATTSFEGTVAGVYGGAMVVYFDGKEDQPVHVLMSYSSGGIGYSVVNGWKVRVLARPRGTSDKYAADFSRQELPRVLAVDVEVLESSTGSTSP